MATDEITLKKYGILSKTAIDAYIIIGHSSIKIKGNLDEIDPDGEKKQYNISIKKKDNTFKIDQPDFDVFYTTPPFAWGLLTERVGDENENHLLKSEQKSIVEALYAPTKTEDNPRINIKLVDDKGNDLIDAKGNSLVDDLTQEVAGIFTKDSFVYNKEHEMGGEPLTGKGAGIIKLTDPNKTAVELIEVYEGKMKKLKYFDEDSELNLDDKKDHEFDVDEHGKAMVLLCKDWTDKDKNNKTRRIIYFLTDSKMTKFDKAVWEEIKRVAKKEES